MRDNVVEDGMSKKFRESNTNQSMFFPPNVNDFLSPGHLAYFVRDLVKEDLKLGGIRNDYVEEKGAPPYPPESMVSLLLYGYSRGVYSSRQLAKACEERVDFMVVAGMLKPNFRTINKFRVRHLEELGNLFQQVLNLCKKAGLVKLGHVALDGTKIKANAAKDSGLNYGNLKKEEAQLMAEIKSWFKAADETDKSEDEEFGISRRGDELPEWVSDKQEKLERIRAAKEALENSAKEKQEARKADEDDDKKPPSHKTKGDAPSDSSRHNFTDPDSRMMKTRQGFEQAYNGQIAVDSDSQVIVACDLTNNGADVDHLIEMVEQVKENVGKLPKELSADAGYCSEHNLRNLNNLKLNSYIAIENQRKKGKRKTKSGTCVHKMSLKLRKGGKRSRYRLRAQTVETVFGIIKAVRGFRQCFLRGLNKVEQEWKMVCTVHNLLKLAA